MEARFDNDLKRRRKEILKFYYFEIGSLIRKKRLEMKLTQEELSKGIFSHTYLSKIEHNAISVNKDSLFMVMERINMSTDEYSLPEEMLVLLETGLKHFFYGDKESYQKLYEDTLEFQYGILVDISRLGYYVISGDVKRAKTSYDELHRYLCAIEDFGFTIYALFGCYYNIMIGDFSTARRLYEACIQYQSMNEEIFCLFEYAKFIIYGHLEYYNLSRDGYENSKNIFISKGVFNRVKEMNMYLNLFRLYEGMNVHGKIEPDLFQYTHHSHAHKYLIVRSMASPHCSSELDLIDQDSPYYPIGLFVKAIHLSKSIGSFELDSIIDAMRMYYERHLGESVNYLDLLELKLSNHLQEYKDYLINHLLPVVSESQNFFFIRRVYQEITSIMYKTKRYKDGLTYQIKCDKFIENTRK